MSLSERPVGEFLAALGERTPTPASGAATALTAALAAALVELAGRFAGDEEAVVRAKALWSRLAELADEDAAAYKAFMADRSEAKRERIIAVPEEIAACADEVGRARRARPDAAAHARWSATPKRRRARPGRRARRAHGSPSSTPRGRPDERFLHAMPKVGIEPTRPEGQWILSPSRLPIPPLRPAGVNGNRAHGIGLRVSRQ